MENKHLNFCADACQWEWYTFEPMTYQNGIYDMINEHVSCNTCVTHQRIYLRVTVTVQRNNDLWNGNLNKYR